jgi:hypothetical protein
MALWITPYHFGVDQGPVVLMIENYRTGLIWNIMRRCPYIADGLRRAGFQGGWLWRPENARKSRVVTNLEIRNQRSLQGEAVRFWRPLSLYSHA